MQLEASDLVGHSLLSICGEDTDAKAIKTIVTAQRDAHHSQGTRALCFRRDGSPFWWAPRVHVMHYVSKAHGDVDIRAGCDHAS